MTYLLFLLIGAGAGFIQGLLGVGGGTVVVPMTMMALATTAGMPSEMIIKVAIATSFMSMLLSSVFSIATHHRNGAVRWPIVIRMLPGLIVGTSIGATLVHFADSRYLRIVFALFVLGVGASMLVSPKPEQRVRYVPNQFKYRLLHLSTLAVGIVSGLFGVGGGMFNVPNLQKRGLAIAQAIATSAATTWPVALIGALSLMLHQPKQAIEHAVGYVYLPAFIGIVLPAMLFSSIGAKAAHRLRAELLRLIFSIFLIVVGLRLLLF